MKWNERFWRLSVFTFGSFAFGWVLGILFHELGHAISMWLTGGKVARIVITPFSWSYTYYGSSPPFPQFSTWSGVLIGSVLGLSVLLMIILLRKQNSPYAVPFLFLGIAPMLNGGGYFLVDLFVTRQGDAFSLVRRGAPLTVVLGAGILLLVLSVTVLVRNLHRIGIEPSDSFRTRLAVLSGGILSYFTAGLVFTILQVPEDLLFMSTVFLAALGFVLVASYLSRKRSAPPEAMQIQWKHALYAAVLGLAAIVVLQWIFP